MLTIAEASRLIDDKQLSPVELTQSCLERMKQLDGRLNAFLLVTEERALADAKAAEATADQREQPQQQPAAASDAVNESGDK